jgi:hypothetical protein
MVIKRTCLLSFRNENMLDGSSAVKTEALPHSNLRYATESQCQLFKCILLGYLKLGDEGNAFLRNVSNRIHIKAASHARRLEFS